MTLSPTNIVERTNRVLTVFAVVASLAGELGGPAHEPGHHKGEGGETHFSKCPIDYQANSALTY